MGKLSLAVVGMKRSRFGEMHEQRGEDLIPFSSHYALKSPWSESERYSENTSKRTENMPLIHSSERRVSEMTRLEWCQSVKDMLQCDAIQSSFCPQGNFIHHLRYSEKHRYFATSYPISSSAASICD